jgi:hypothetical protein
MHVLFSCWQKRPASNTCSSPPPHQRPWQRPSSCACSSQNSAKSARTGGWLRNLRTNLRDVYGESSAFVWPRNMSYQPTFIHSVDKNLVLSRAVYPRKGFTKYFIFYNNFIITRKITKQYKKERLYFFSAGRRQGVNLEDIVSFITGSEAEPPYPLQLHL